MITTKSALAIHGGSKAIQSDPGDTFGWPIITQEDEEAVLEVLRRGAMSGTDVTVKFEEQFAAWQGAKYALACNNGTAALHCALFGAGIGVGDEIICPSRTYWASALPVFSLGATVVFADIDPETLCIAPDDIEHRIGPEHARHSGGSLCRSSGRYGPHHGDRAAAWPESDRGCIARAGWDVQGQEAGRLW